MTEYEFGGMGYQVGVQAPLIEALQPAPAEILIDPVDALQNGLAILEGWDAAHIGGLQLDAGRPGCQGSLAEYLGNPNHTQIVERLAVIVDRARKSGSDPASALVGAVDVFTARGVDDQPVIEPLDELKKKLNPGLTE